MPVRERTKKTFFYYFDQKVNYKFIYKETIRKI